MHKHFELRHIHFRYRLFFLFNSTICSDLRATARKIMQGILQIGKKVTESYGCQPKDDSGHIFTIQFKYFVELPDKDSLGIKTCSNAACCSLNRLVSDVLLFNRMTQKKFTTEYTTVSCTKSGLIISVTGWTHCSNKSDFSDSAG
jgi:hypothetical protein